MAILVLSLICQSLAYFIFLYFCCMFCFLFVLLKSKEPPQTFVQQILVDYIFFQVMHQPNACKFEEEKKNQEKFHIILGLTSWLK